MPALLLLTLLALGFPARGDVPLARCHAEPYALMTRAEIPGRVVGMEATRDGERLVIALRALVGQRARLYVGELGPDGNWAVAPREVTVVRPRRTDAIALGAGGGHRQLVLVSARRIVTVVLGSDAGGDAATELTRPPRATGSALIATDANGFVLAWPRLGRATMQRLALGESVPTAAPELRLPERTMLVSITPGEEGTAGLIVRSPGRRYFVAIAHPDGSVRWPRNGPAGCDERGRCPAVRLLSAPGGYVATWAAHPTEDHLAVFGARPIDTDGHTRGRATTFIPVVRGMLIAGPQGQGWLLQLGRPIVMRGPERPAGVPVGELASNEFPIVAHAWVAPEAGPGLEIVAATNAGAVTRTVMRCESLPAGVEH